MTFDSDSPSSPKRSLPAVEASNSDTTKKIKVENKDDLTEGYRQLSKKDKKKYTRAKKLGQKVDVTNEVPIFHPKFYIRHENGCASFNDIRNLIMGVLFHDTKLPKGLEIHERQQLSKCVVVDVPILCPSVFENDDDDDNNNNNSNDDDTANNGDLCYYNMLSKSTSPAQVFRRWIDPNSPYVSFLHHIGIDLINDNGCAKENDAFGKVASGSCDRRKGLMDRFGQLLQCKLTKGQIKKVRQQVNDDYDLAPEELMLTRQELINENYPLHSSYLQDDENGGALPEGWIETPTGHGSTTTRKKLLAMDCEMCKSGRRFVLTKIALVDQDHKVLLNEFVKPDCVITDYVTDYSGVDEASLMGVTTTLQDIQQRLLQYIDADTILVGHGLVNDLQVLKMRHAYIIDTAVIYHHHNGPPYKPALKDLTTMILHRQIQQHHTSTTTTTPVVRGHDPCEDAIASMELVQLKMKKGRKFGLHADYLTELMVDRLAEHGKSGVMILDSSHEIDDSLLAKELDEHSRAYRVTGSKAAVQLAVEHHTMNDLVFVQLKQDNNSIQVMDQVRWLYDHLEVDTALIMLAGGFNTNELDRLRKKFFTYKNDLKARPLDEIPDNERWTELDEHRLDTLVELAKRYYIIPCIKYC